MKEETYEEKVLRLFGKTVKELEEQYKEYKEEIRDIAIKLKEQSKEKDKN